MIQPNWVVFDGQGNYDVPDGLGPHRRDHVGGAARGAGPRCGREEMKGFPNGCGVPPDGSRLYVVETCPSDIVEIDIRPDGGRTPSRPRGAATTALMVSPSPGDGSPATRLATGPTSSTPGKPCRSADPAVILVDGAGGADQRVFTVTTSTSWSCRT